MSGATDHVEKYCPTCERSYHAGKLCEVDGTELVTLGGADPLVGRALNDRYTIHDRLGAGGMGTVYRGVQHSVGREVAIKVVSGGLVTDPAAIKRFLREAKLASRLSHPNAVSMLDFGQTPDGLFYLVMELLVGRTLDKVLRDEVRLPLPRVLRIASQVCDALDGAHRLAIIHRDLKPANVMLLDGDRDLIKVLDFGLAKSLSQDSASLSMTASGALLGTPAYMSPEAALGRELDARGDLYSLGCMLYVLASGRLPFHSESVHELVAMHANEPPPPVIGVPPPVADVIMRLLAKEPRDRYESAAAVRIALEQAAARSSSMEALASTLPPDAGAIRATPMPLAAVDVNAMTLHSSPVAAAAPRASSEPTSSSDVRAAAPPRASSESAALSPERAAAASIAPSESRARSRAPLAIAGLVAAGGLAIAGYIAMSGGGKEPASSEGSANTNAADPATATNPANSGATSSGAASTGSTDVANTGANAATGATSSSSDATKPATATTSAKPASATTTTGAATNTSPSATKPATTTKPAPPTKPATTTSTGAKPASPTSSANAGSPKPPATAPVTGPATTPPAPTTPPPPVTDPTPPTKTDPPPAPTPPKKGTPF